MRFALSIVLAVGAASAALAQVDTKPPAPDQEQRKPGPYALGADSLEQPGVPRGQLLGPHLFKSKILAGTARRYWIYVPAQYSPERPANVLVFQDGQRATNPTGSLRVPQVLENLIHKKEIPVTIGIFITPGHRGDVYPDDLGTGNPNNRAAEYDALDDAYARFVVDEMLPEVGKSYRLTSEPAGRAIGGSSSGAICAFTVAWHRPDQLRNVISFIGSYTSIGYRPARDGQPLVPGGDLYPTLIRKSPIKPLKVFLQDGANDLDNAHGNWFLANQQMLAAFAFANAAADVKQTPGPRYEVKHVWGDGGHSDVHGGAILPDVLRWIWSSPQQEERPLPRSYHAAAVVNGKIYVIGGAGADNKPVASVQVYDPVTGTWAARADMPTARALFGASAVGGTIYAVGGTTRGTDKLAVVEAYDTVTDTWTRKADMPTPRNALSTAMVDGKVYAIGGWGSDRPGTGWAFVKDFSTVEVYDPKTDTWATRADMPTARSHMTVSASGGRIYAIGGGVRSASRGESLALLEVYDTATNRWAPAADLPTPRSVLSSSIIDGRIHVMGGVVSGPASTPAEALPTMRTLSVVEVYDPASGRWTKGADLATGRGWFSTSVVNGKVYVVGGRYLAPDRGTEVNFTFPGIEVYTPTR